MRCIAFSECKNLVRPHRFCQVCVSPALWIDKGAVTAATVGQQLSIPLVLANTAGANRTLWVKQVAIQIGNGPFTPISLMWERVDTGEERVFFVETGALEAGGIGAVSIALTVASRYKGYEENYVLGGNIQFRVNAATDGNIIQNIDFTGATLGTGALVNPRLEADKLRDTSSPGNSDRVHVPLEPLEKFELEQGIRGYVETGHRIPRNVGFRYTGFPTGFAPTGMPSIGARGVLVFGRNLRTFDAETNPDPSDITLRVVDPSTGELERELTMGVSRRHFDLLVMNERLYAHIRSSNGVDINGNEHTTAQLVPLSNGDVISPIANRPDLVALRVTFHSQPNGLVETIELTHDPRHAT